MPVPTAVPEDRRRAFGLWLKEQRERLGFTQEEIARRAAMTRQQLNRLETGKSGTRMETIPRLALALATSNDEMSRRAGFVPSPEVESDELFARDIERMLHRVPIHQRGMVKDRLRRQAEDLVSLLTEPSR